MERVHTGDAPNAIGPYSQAMVGGGMIFTAGQIGLEPATGILVEGGIRAQAERAMQNLAAVLGAAGADFSNVIQTTIFLTDMSDFPTVNEIYGSHLGDHRPARSTVAAAALPAGAVVEIAMIALRP